MVSQSKSLKWVFGFLAGISVSIICVGSLINFHQYHIWHKPLVLNLVAYKRDSEKIQKSTVYYDFTSGFDIPVSASVETVDFPIFIQSIPACSFIVNEHLLYSSGLRAPPAV